MKILTLPRLAILVSRTASRDDLVILPRMIIVRFQLLIPAIVMLLSVSLVIITIEIFVAVNPCDQKVQLIDNNACFVESRSSCYFKCVLIV